MSTQNINLSSLFNIYKKEEESQLENPILELMKKTKKISSHIKDIKLSDDHHFLYASSLEFKKKTIETNSKLESIMQKIFNYTSKEHLNKLSLQDFDFHLFTSMNDLIIDKFSIDLSILKGERKENLNEDIEKEIENQRKLRVEFSVLKVKGLKPKFNEGIYETENSYFPFIPKIKEKQHAKRPLDIDIIEALDYWLKNKVKFLNFTFADRKLQKEFKFSHPYQIEIEEFYDDTAKRLEKIDIFYENVSHVSIINELLISLASNGFVNKFNLTSIMNGILFSSSTEQSEVSLISDDIKRLMLEAEIYLIKNTSSVMKYTNYIEYSTNLYYKYSFSEDLFNSTTIGVDDTINNITNFMEFITKRVYPYKSLSETDFLYVETIEDLKNSVLEMEKYNEIAIDLEAHMNESYQGLTCLMQISSREKDYIIDCIKLRSEMNVLNKIFCNPKIIKVLHGSDYDILWLQRDFGLYIVNLFDTGIAAKILKYPQKSLQFLLSSICNVMADKKYQLSDWRIRPIPNEMMKYAREDTHYLLFIYDHLKYELIKQGFNNNKGRLTYYLFLAMKESNNLSLKIYTKPEVKSNQYYSLIDRSGNMNKSQLTIYKLILKFRDYIGRKMDYNPNYIWNVNICHDLAKLSFSDYNEDKIYTFLKKNKANEHSFAFINEFISLVKEKYKIINEEIDLISSTTNVNSNYMSVVNMMTIKNNIDHIRNKDKVVYISNQSNIDEKNSQNIKIDIASNTKSEKFSFFNQKEYEQNIKIEIKEDSFMNKKENKMDNNKESNNLYYKVLNKLSFFNLVDYLKDKTKKFSFSLIKKEENYKKDDSKIEKKKENKKSQIKEEENKINYLHSKRVKDMTEGRELDINNDDESSNKEDINDNQDNKISNINRLNMTTEFMDRILNIPGEVKKKKFKKNERQGK